MDFTLTIMLIVMCGVLVEGIVWACRKPEKK